MVELQTSPFDQNENIPFVHASIVTVDEELTEILPQDIIVGPEYAVFDSVPVAASVTETIRSCSCSTHSSDPSVVSSVTPTFSTTNHVDDSSSIPSVGINEEEESPQVLGAGAAGAVLGMLLGGPIVSIVLGISALFYSQEEGAAGDIARAMGYSPHGPHEVSRTGSETSSRRQGQRGCRESLVQAEGR
jgi:hypothetical protein